MALILEQAIAPLVVVGSVVDQPILVAAAGLVVVLAILLVFVMVLRSGGNKRTPVGIGYDAQQGPLGQPKAPPSQPGTYGPRGGMGAQGWQQPGGFGAPGAPSGQDRGWGQAYPNPQNQWNEPAAAQAPVPAQAPGWGPAAQGGQWQDRQDQGVWNQGPAAQPAWPGAWGQAPAEQPGQPGQPGLQGSWGQPQNQPASSWGQPADMGGGWGGPTAAPPAPAQPGYGQPGFGQPAPSNGGGWTGGLAPSGGADPGYGQPAYGDIDRARAARPANAPRAALLIVRQGKEPGRTYEVRKDRMTIGRSRESDIFLEDLAVSRTHTSIGRDDRGRYIVRDENSANGTYVNGQRISEQVLEDGDEVQVGQTVLAFSRR